jgi:CRP/FNR family transcriptional regulator
VLVGEEQAMQEPVSREEPRTSGEANWLDVNYTYPRGVELFLQGQLLQEVLFLVQGVVKLTQSDIDGRESIVGLASAGEWIGTAAVVANRRAPVTAVTCSSAVLRRVPSGTFRRRLQYDRELSRQIFEAHATELCRQTTRIGQLCSLSSLQRLQCALCKLSGRNQGSATVGSPLRLPLHRWELAEFIGVTPEHLSRLLTMMVNRRLIRREKGSIDICDLVCACEAEAVGEGVGASRAAGGEAPRD